MIHQVLLIGSNILLVPSPKVFHIHKKKGKRKKIRTDERKEKEKKKKRIKNHIVRPNTAIGY